MPRMYVLVRRDLDSQYRNVQGGHALALFALEHPDLFKTWNNETLIYLGVSNLITLRAWAEKIKVPFSLFKEPDLDGQETALACYCDDHMFRELSLA